MGRCGRGLEEARQESAKKLGPIPSERFMELSQHRGLGDYGAKGRGNSH